MKRWSRCSMPAATGSPTASSPPVTSVLNGFYRETRSGILNRNRSTNQASPRLPFGGSGKSGNYRPAGAHAARNVVSAVAVQKNVAGRIQMHPHLVDHMPPPELDRLELQHSAEEATEASRNLVDEPRPMRMELPRGGVLPQSDQWLTRLYAGERVVREKKPPVFDHLRSAGPWLVSVDAQPLSVLDGMSQTATLCGGFAEEAVVRAYIEDEFGDALVTNRDPVVEAHDPATAYATVLRHLVPGLPNVTFTNSGAEANEKALALCSLHGKNAAAKKVLAFEGSFHGRTLLSLHATHSPAKRGPFEIDGYQASFAPFPTWETPMSQEPAAPSGYYAAAGAADRETLATRFGDESEDPLLASEIESLLSAADYLASGEYFACIIEPMQSEGGDRYATARFFRALRLLTRHYDVPLIFDEVQTGFSLGGSFVWHSKFQLVNFRGEPDTPDAVTFAKRAQLGVCMSRFEDPEPTSVQVASLIRGRLHAEMASTSHAAVRIEKLVQSRLTAVAQGFPHLVTNPRACGYSFAFDLPSPSHLKAYLGQRFWRGAVVFGAGTRTARYRLSEGYLAREVDLLFEGVRRSLAWLDAHPGAQPPVWEDRADAGKTAASKKRETLRVRNASHEDALEYLPAILDIEYRVYEPARRTDPALIRAAIEDPDAVVQLAELQHEGRWTFAGFAIGHPLEAAAEHEEGPDRDPMLGHNNTLYSLSLTVAPELHGQGIGRRLKEAQLRDAAARRQPDGSQRYRFVTGRNRVGLTAAMTRLNRIFGSHLVCVLTGQYEDPEGQAVYYRIPLAPLAPARTAETSVAPEQSMATGISRPLEQAPASLVQAERSGLLYGPAVNKLTVMNYVSPAVVRSLEWISALAPRQPHLYLTSSRDETVDKSLRLLRTHRSEAQVAIGLRGGYVGHTSAAARSISDATLHRQGAPYFDWPQAPHPVPSGNEAALRSVRELIEAAGGPQAIFGIYVEPVQERTGWVADEDFWRGLAEIRSETGVPLVSVDTATACYRSGRGPFFSSLLPVAPDMVLWWGGAHTGYIHVVPDYRVATPLAMVSTWDGDELSLVREHHQLRAARRLDLDEAVAALESAMSVVAKAGLSSAGAGLLRVVHAGDRAVDLAEALGERGLAPRAYPGGYLAFVPPLDRAAKLARQLEKALGEVLQ